MTDNKKQLLCWIKAMPIGLKFECATSQYADNTTPPGHRFDCYSTAPAVRSLVKSGFIKAESRWRYYDCEIISHTGERK